MKDRTYLGDGVYAEQDGYHIWLWTSNGVADSDRIALEPAVLDALFAYRGRLLERVRVARKDAEDADADANR